MVISVVVLNWNRKKDTLECLESISKSNLSDFKCQIIVVDNASSDNSRVEVKKALKKITFKNKNVSGELIKNKENLGFATGNNIGIKHALNHEADFILLLNNDTVIDKNLFQNLTSAIQNYPDVGLISPKIYFAPDFEFHKERYKGSDVGKVIWYAGGDIDWKNVYATNHGVDEIDHGQFNKIKETDFATGACMLCRAEALKETGLFDEKYFMYFEDADLSCRMKRKNWKILYYPPARIWHKVAQSSVIGGGLNDYYTTRNRLLFGTRYALMRTKFALYRESLRFIVKGRKWQKRGAIDFYFRKFGRGSWK